MIETNQYREISLETITPYVCGEYDAQNNHPKAPHYYSNGKYIKFVCMTELQIIDYYAGYDSVK
jgi:hypothetical protein